MRRPAVGTGVVRTVSRGRFISRHPPPRRRRDTPSEALDTPRPGRTIRSIRPRTTAGAVLERRAKDRNVPDLQRLEELGRPLVEPAEDVPLVPCGIAIDDGVGKGETLPPIERHCFGADV